MGSRKTTCCSSHVSVNFPYNLPLPRDLVGPAVTERDYKQFCTDPENTDRVKKETNWIVLQNSNFPE